MTQGPDKVAIGSALPGSGLQLLTGLDVILSKAYVLLAVIYFLKHKV